MNLPLTVSYISDGTVRAEFCDSLAALLQRYRVESRIALVSGPRISTSRNNVVRAFLADCSAEYLLMLDSDMTFTPDDIRSLVLAAQREDAHVVGGLCFSVDDDGRIFPTIYEGDPPKRTYSYRKDSLQEVSATGAACLLMSRTLLEDMAKNCPGPHEFFQETTHKGGEFGEDVTFCVRARHLGYRIYVHTGVQLGHCKTFQLTAAEFEAQNRGR